MIRRIARIIAWVISVAAATAVAGGAAIVGRLSQGPIQLDALAPYVEEALTSQDGRLSVSIGSLVLGWTTETETGDSVLDLRAMQVRAANAEGALIAAVPELGIGFSLRELLFGRLSPTRLDLIHPQINIIHHKDGHYGFDIRDAEASSADQAGAEADGALLDALRQPPDRHRPLGLLRRLTVVGADLWMQNRAIGSAWHATRANITLLRGAQGIDAHARLALTLGTLNSGTLTLKEGGGNGAAMIDMTGAYRTQDGTSDGLVTVRELELSRLAEIIPALEPLRTANISVGGALAVRLDAAFKPQRLRFDLDAGPGRLSLPIRPEPYAIRAAHARGEVDLDARRLTVERATLGLAEARFGLSGTLTEKPDGPAGEAQLTLEAGGRTATAQVTTAPESNGQRVTATVMGLYPAILAPLAPDLAPLSAVTLPIDGTVEADLDSRFQPYRGRVALTAGAGQVEIPNVLEGPVAVKAARLRAHGENVTGRLEVEALTIDLDGAMVQATGQAGISGDTVAITAEATANNVRSGELHRYWPLTMSANARQWVTTNLTGAVVHKARLTVAGTAPLADLMAFEPTGINALIEGENADVAYFRPLPPVIGIERFQASVDGKTMTINTQGGRVEDAKLGAGTIVIHDLGGKEHIEIDTPVQGPVRTILTVLNNPPLEYPKRLSMDPKHTAGSADARLRLQFPLVVDLKVEQIDVGVTAKLRDVALEKIAAGMDTSDGMLDLTLDIKGMAVKGKTRIDGIPSTVHWQESFVSDGKGPRTQITVKATPKASDFIRFIPDPTGYAEGPVGADILFTIDQRKRFALTGNLDLGKTTLTIPELGWTKPPGTAASGRFALEFQKDKVIKVSGVAVEGGGLKGAGSIDLLPATTGLARIRVDDLSVGRTRARGELVPRDGGYAVTLSGDSLDAEAFLKKTRSAADSAAEEKRKPLSVNAQLGQVVFGEGRKISQVTAAMHHDGAAWSQLTIKGRAGDKGSLSVVYGLQEGPRHQLTILAEEAGTVLRMLDVSDRIEGGTLRINGMTQEPGPGMPIKGQAELQDYTLIEAPTLARILNALSLGGLTDLMKSKGIPFGMLQVDFRKEGRLLTLRELRTAGSALGLTLEGEVNMADNTADLSGTLVPFYGINRIIGQIPLLGDALSGGAGQGIFAATWRVRGPLSAPDVSVNPLAVLAPGFLRNLFFLGGKKSDPSTLPHQDGRTGN